jgi:polyhydroxybutyrate depolymerase
MYSARRITFCTFVVLLLMVASLLQAYADELTDHTIQVGGKARTYHIHKDKPPTKPVPLVVILHGGGGNGKILKDTYGFKPFIVAGECIAVYPDAGAGGWLPDDVAFVDAVIEEVFAREKVDRERLFVTGASRGGLLTFVMAARSKHSIRAAGSVIASQLQGLADEFPFVRPIDFAMIAGTADPLMPYLGGFNKTTAGKSEGDPKARVLPVEETIKLLLKANEIQTDPTVSTLGNKDANDGCTNEVRNWLNAKTGRRVMLVKVEGGGHVVPGGRQYLPQSVIGPVCNDFQHAEIMWEFFQSAGQASPKSNASPRATDKPTPENKSLSAESEQALRTQVNALFEALSAGDVEKCLALSDPAVVKAKGRDTAEKFFKGVSGLIKFAKVQAKDRVIKSITPLDDGQAAKVEVELTLNGKKQPPGYEIWGLVDGQWYYRETPK